MKFVDDNQATDVPQLSWSKKIAWAVAGLVWFFWIGYEDRGLVTVLIVSAVIAVPVGIEAYDRWRVKLGVSFWQSTLRGALAGTLSGALVGSIAILITLMKVSLHQHVIPDFSSGDILTLLNRIPAWSIAGLLIGSSLAMIVWGKDHVP